MLKYIFDRVVSFLGLVLLLPFMLIISVLIYIEDRRNPFFVQKRIGRYGKPFKIIKFRTMSVNDRDELFTIKGDDRITSIGKHIRAYKLDELPQLINVLIGDMSFVGPRPVVLGYYDKIVGENKKILQLRPGITSLATLKYSNEDELLAKVENPEKYNEEVIYPDKLKMELDYYYNHSFFGDLKIIFKTYIYIYI